MLDINPTSLQGFGIVLVGVFILGILMKVYSSHLLRKESKKEGA